MQQRRLCCYALIHRRSSDLQPVTVDGVKGGAGDRLHFSSSDRFFSFVQSHQARTKITIIRLKIVAHSFIFINVYFSMNGNVLVEVLLNLFT